MPLKLLFSLVLIICGSLNKPLKWTLNNSDTFSSLNLITTTLKNSANSFDSSLIDTFIFYLDSFFLSKFNL